MTDPWRDTRAQLPQTRFTGGAYAGTNPLLDGGVCPVLTGFSQSPDTGLMCVTRQWSYMCQSRKDNTDKLSSQVITLVLQTQWHLGKTRMSQLSAAPTSPLSRPLWVPQPSLNLGLT